MRHAIRWLSAKAGIPVVCDQHDHEFVNSIDDEASSRLVCLLTGMVLGAIVTSIWWVTFLYLST